MSRILQRWKQTLSFDLRGAKSAVSNALPGTAAVETIRLSAGQPMSSLLVPYFVRVVEGGVVV